MSQSTPAVPIATTPSRRFACFISYKHGSHDPKPGEPRGDSSIARALHSALHRLARPWWKLRALHVFRDETVLAAGDDLPGAIKRALNHSDYLLLLASPEAAGSEWVIKEVVQWLEHDQEAERVVIALTRGELVFDGAGGGYDAALSDALPAPLFAAIKREPKWVDLRTLTDPAIQSLHNDAFLAAAVGIAARLHGKSPEDLRGEDRSRQRQAIRMLTFGIALLGVLAVVAWWQRNEAVIAQTRAEAGQLSLQSQVALQRDPREALPLLAAALERLQARDLPVIHEAEVAARTTLHAARDDVRWAAGATMMRELIARDDGLLMVGGDLAQLRTKDTGLLAAPPWTDDEGLPLGTRALSLQGDAGVLHLVGVDLHGRTRWHQIELAGGKRRSATVQGLPAPVGIAVAHDGQVVVVDKSGLVKLLGRNGETARQWSLPGGGPIVCMELDPLCVIADRVPVFSGDATEPGIGLPRNARLIALDLVSGGTTEIESPHTAVSRLLLADGTLWSIGSEGLAQKYSVHDRRIEREEEPIRAHSEPSTAIDVANGRIAIGSRSGLIRVWHGGADAAFDLRGHVAAIRGLAFAADNRCRLWSLSDDGVVRGWDLCAPIVARDDQQSWERQSPDGRWLARASTTEVVVATRVGETRRRVACAEAAARMVELLAVSNQGDVLAKCPGTQQLQTAEWVMADASRPSQSLPEDEHTSAWFMDDTSVVLAVGSFMTGIPDLEVPPELKPLRLLEVKRGGDTRAIDLRPHGAAVSATRGRTANELLIGTAGGRLLQIDVQDWAIESNLPLVELADPNSQNAFPAINQVTCCLGSDEIVAVIGMQGMPGALSESMRDLVVVFDLTTKRVRAVLRGERRSVLGVALLGSESDIALVYGSADPMSGFGDSAVLRLFDHRLRALSPAYPMPGGMFASMVATDSGDRLSLVGLGEGRALVDISLPTVIDQVKRMAAARAREDQISQWLQQSSAAQDASDWPTLERLCTSVLELMPEDTSCRLRRGNARASQLRFAESIDDYDRVDQLDPYNNFLPLQRTKSLIALQRFDEAEREATRAIERAHLIIRPALPVMEPDHPMYEFNRKFAEAMIAIASAGQAEPSTLRANIRIQLGKLAGAKEDLERARALGAGSDQTEWLWERLREAEAQQTIAKGPAP